MLLFSIRLAALRDIPLLDDVERSAATVFMEIQDYNPSGRTVPAELLKEMAIGKKLWVAVNGADKPVGFVGCEGMDDILYVHEISVAREVQKQGIGRKLMQVVLNESGLRGYSAIGLTTRRDAPWNMPFYKTLGFYEMTDSKECPLLWTQLQKEIEDGAAPSIRCAMIKSLKVVV